MTQSARQKLLRLFRNEGLVRSREVERGGLPRWMLYELVKAGTVSRMGRGLYSLTNSKPTENHSYAEAIKRAPSGVLCLLSALRFHGLTMENPVEVWVAVPHGSWRSRSSGIKMRTVQLSDKGLTVGVERYRIEGVTVPVTNVARTITDCFKFRNKIGTDVALEALREAWRKKLFTMDELWGYIRILRMSRVMMPYLEAIG